MSSPVRHADIRIGWKGLLPARIQSQPEFPCCLRQTPDDDENDEKAKRRISVRNPIPTVRFTCMEVSLNLTEDLQQM